MSKADWLSQLQAAWSTCQGCMLANERRSVVFGYGNPDAKILVIGEAPGINEDIQGFPFVGSAGMLLDQYLCVASASPELVEQARFLDNEDTFSMYSPDRVRELLRHEVFYTNVVACKPPENRDPTPGEIMTCHPRLTEIIYTVDPVIIICAGRIAVEALLGKKVSITKDRGEVYDIQIPGRHVDAEGNQNTVTYPTIAVLHPAYLQRINDFNQRGGMSDKTGKDYLHAMNILDWFMELHYEVPKPADRPKDSSK